MRNCKMLIPSRKNICVVGNEFDTFDAPRVASVITKFVKKIRKRVR
jgi:hypothetical protein